MMPEISAVPQRQSSPFFLSAKCVRVRRVVTSAQSDAVSTGDGAAVARPPRLSELMKSTAPIIHSVPSARIARERSFEPEEFRVVTMDAQSAPVPT